MTITKSETPDETEIHLLIDDWAKALRNKDADGIVSHYAAHSVMFVMAPPLQYTSNNSPGKNGIEEWFATWDGPIGYEIRDVKITASEDVAFSHSLNRMSGTKTDGEKVDMWLRETFCFRRLGGQWKITHQHESVPFYMDGSYKAAVDLKP